MGKLKEALGLEKPKEVKDSARQFGVSACNGCNDNRGLDSQGNLLCSFGPNRVPQIILDPTNPNNYSADGTPRTGGIKKPTNITKEHLNVAPTGCALLTKANLPEITSPVALPQSRRR